MSGQAITAVERNIGIMAHNNGVLASMLSNLQTSRQATYLRLLLQDTAHIARETGELLLAVQQELPRTLPQQRAVLIKLGKDFQIILRRFQHLTEQSARQARYVKAEPIGEAAGCDSSDAGGSSTWAQRHPTAGGGGRGAASSAAEEDEEEEHEDGIDASEKAHLIGGSSRAAEPLVGGRGGCGSSSRAPALRAAQLQQQMAMESRVDHDTLAEREQIISQVETTLDEVREIFTDLAGFVKEQSQYIDHISSAIENTAAKTGRTADELWHASRHQNRGRSHTCCLGLAIVVTLVVFLAVGLSLRA